MLRKIFIGVSFLLAGHTLAATNVWQSGVLSRVYPQGNGDFVITFKGDSPDCSNASDPKYHYIRNGVNGVSAEGVKAMLSTALAAGMSGKTISINFNKDASTCDVRKLLVEF